jgi:chromate transporter
MHVFLKLGAMSYGGPAIMGLMQAEIQERRAWLSKERFVEGLALVNMLPGAGATQLGIFLGYMRAGWWGGLLAGVCFILPAFFIMLALTWLYLQYGALPAMRQVFYGLNPVVVAIFALAVIRLGKAAITDRRQILIALAATAAMAFTPLGLVWLLLLAGAVGVALYGARRAGVIALVVLALVIAVVETVAPQALLPAAMTADSGADAPRLSDIFLFFFKVGAFTFGGGLSMLAFMQDQVVNQFQWLTPQEFLDGLALGQLTPGPILMLAAFVGYKLDALWGALIGGAAIFLPSFILMLTLLPMWRRVAAIRWMRAALKGIGPAVIGMIAVALLRMLPAALPDLPTAVILLVTLALLWRLRASPLLLMLGGGGVGLALGGI